MVVAIWPRRCGATTRRGTRLSAVADSSQVISSTPFCCQAAELVIWGTTPDSQRSAVRTPQSWPSLQSPGVIHESCGVVPLRSDASDVMDTTFDGHWPP